MGFSALIWRLDATLRETKQIPRRRQCIRTHRKPSPQRQVLTSSKGHRLKQDLKESFCPDASVANTERYKVHPSGGKKCHDRITKAKSCTRAVQRTKQRTASPYVCTAKRNGATHAAYNTLVQHTTWPQPDSIDSTSQECHPLLVV